MQKTTETSQKSKYNDSTDPNRDQQKTVQLSKKNKHWDRKKKITNNRLEEDRLKIRPWRFYLEL